MALKLMYITRDPAVAAIAEEYGVDRIFIDSNFAHPKQACNNA